MKFFKRHGQAGLAGMLVALACAPAAAHGVNFAAPASHAVGNAPQHISVADFNGDSDPDLAVVNQSDNNVSVLLGGAGGTFGSATNFAVGLTPLAAAVGDFNGDFDPDMAVANEAANTV